MGDEQEPPGSRGGDFWGAIGRAFLSAALLGLGALLTATVGPYVAQNWQDNQQDLSAKEALVADMSGAASDMLTATDVAETQPSRKSRVRLNAAFVRWLRDSAVISSKLGAYAAVNGDGSAAADWRTFADSINQLYVIYFCGYPQRAEHLAQLKRDLAKLVGRTKASVVDWRGLATCHSYVAPGTPPETQWKGLLDQEFAAEDKALGKVDIVRLVPGPCVPVFGC